MDEIQEFQVRGCETITRTVKRQGNSGSVGIPVSWLGCDVVVIRLPSEDAYEIPAECVEDVYRAEVVLEDSPSPWAFDDLNDIVDHIVGYYGGLFDFRDTETGKTIDTENQTVESIYLRPCKGAEVVVSGDVVGNVTFYKIAKIHPPKKGDGTDMKRMEEAAKMAFLTPEQRKIEACRLPQGHPYKTREERKKTVASEIPTTPPGVKGKWY